MTHAESRLLTSGIACVFFGYSVVNSLIFYRRTRRRIEEYKHRPLEGLVQSPQYNWTMWATGIIGAIGFAIASWQFVLSALAILRG